MAIVNETTATATATATVRGAAMVIVTASVIGHVTATKLAED